uniref:Uncharacterized protein n=2 Tax=Chrysotila carterae TaxID=13221 RepID=A0A7S4BGU2_CHRCT
MDAAASSDDDFGLSSVLQEEELGGASGLRRGAPRGARQQRRAAKGARVRTVEQALDCTADLPSALLGAGIAVHTHQLAHVLGGARLAERSKQLHGTAVAREAASAQPQGTRGAIVDACLEGCSTAEDFVARLQLRADVAEAVLRCIECGHGSELENALNQLPLSID